MSDEIPERAVLNLSKPEHSAAFRQAEKAARRDLDDGATVGDVVQELSEAYAGIDAEVLVEDDAAKGGASA